MGYWLAIQVMKLMYTNKRWGIWWLELLFLWFGNSALTNSPSFLVFTRCSSGGFFATMRDEFYFRFRVRVPSVRALIRKHGRNPDPNSRQTKCCHDSDKSIKDSNSKWQWRAHPERELSLSADSWGWGFPMIFQPWKFNDTVHFVRFSFGHWSHLSGGL